MIAVGHFQLQKDLCFCVGQHVWDVINLAHCLDAVMQLVTRRGDIISNDNFKLFAVCFSRSQQKALEWAGGYGKQLNAHK